METKESPKSLDAYELIKLVADTVEYIGRMVHFHTTVLRPKYPWLFDIGGEVYVCFPGQGDIKVIYDVDSTDNWKITSYQKVKASHGLQGAKAEVLGEIANLIKLDYYVALGEDGMFTPDLHPPYTPGQAGKLYLIEVAQAYEKALLKYAEDN